jgi:hypothetical protein
MGIDAQCVKAASEINEKRMVASAARKIKNINLMPGPSGYGMPYFADASVLIWTSSNGREKAAREGLSGSGYLGCCCSVFGLAAS